MQKNQQNIKKKKVVTDLVKLGDGVKPLTEDYKEAILNNTWRPTVVVTGMTGFPPAEGAGNVLRYRTKAKLSIRLPPTFNCKDAEKVVTEVLTKDPPYNSKITVKVINSGNGWAAKDMHQSLKKVFLKVRNFYSEKIIIIVEKVVLFLLLLNQENYILNAKFQ